MKKVMVVAGGDWQVSLVKKAKKLGHFVICTNLYKDSPAFEWADVSEVVDVLDFESNLKVAKIYTPDAIITDQSDIAVPTVAYLNEQMGLRGIGLQTAEQFTNKFKMRQFCIQYGLPTPAFAICNSVQEVQAFLHEYGLSVMKPLNSQSSRGVFKVNNSDNIEEYFKISNELTLRGQAVLMEEYMQGTEFTVDGLQTSEGHISLAVSEKKHYHNYPMVASSLLFSNRSISYDYDHLKKQNDAMINRMGLAFGLTHAEYIWYKNNFYLVEVAARGGGTNISSAIVPCMTGVDNYKKFIDISLGEKCNISDVQPNPEYLKRHSVLKFIDTPPGHVKSIDITDMGFPQNLLDFRINVKPNEYYSGPQDDSKRFGHYIAWANSELELQNICRHVDECIQVKYYDL